MIPVARRGVVAKAEATSGRSEFDLMDAAGGAIANVAQRLIGTLRGRRVIIFCGKGNNGGDGFSAARWLDRLGAFVHLRIVSEPSAVAAEHLSLCSRRVQTVESVRPGGYDLCIDALLGSGSSGPLRGDVADAAAAMQLVLCPILSVDVPTGIDPTAGEDHGACVAAATVCLCAVSPGIVSSAGRDRAGRVFLATLGVEVDSDASDGLLPEAYDVAAMLPKRDANDTKYDVGGVGILAGSCGMPGAGCLAAAGAVNGGAGFVALGVPEPLLYQLSAAPPEVVRFGLPHTDGHLNAESTRTFLERFGQIDALAIGPGIGRRDSCGEAVRQALNARIPVVVDADGLYFLDESMVRSRVGQTVLTPHAGEFERLADDAESHDAVGAHKLAKRFGAVVHLKARSAVTASSDQVFFNQTGNEALATAGTGDVLTGLIAALIARGSDPLSATWSAAWIHGKAGELTGAAKGRDAVKASDVAAMIGRAMSQVSVCRKGHGGAVVEVFQ